MITTKSIGDNKDLALAMSAWEEDSVTKMVKDSIRDDVVNMILGNEPQGTRGNERNGTLYSIAYGMLAAADRMGVIDDAGLADDGFSNADETYEDSDL